MRGKLGDRDVVILIDSGATHNFINMRLVESLSIPLSDTTNYGVVMGSGEAIRGRGICRSVVVTLPEQLITEDFLPFELGNLDLVFGMQWLWKQGGMYINWKNLSMELTVAGTTITLMGDPTLTRMEVTLKVLTKKWGAEDQGFLVEVQRLELRRGEIDSTEILPSPRAGDLNNLLHDFEDVFQMPKGLPPEAS